MGHLLSKIRERMLLWAVMARLWLINATSRSRLINQRLSLPVVSITTHKPRLNTAFLAIESIGRGRTKPVRILLWLSEELAATQLPRSIVRLQGRGLEVRFTEDVGPHTKYYPYVSSCGVDEVMVTADDDVIYPPDWLDVLVAAHERDRSSVICHRAHVVAVGLGGVGEYDTWQPCETSTASIRNFPTGVSGVLYPAHALKALKECGDSFLSVSPRADDIWIHSVLTRAGISTRQAGERPRQFVTVRAAQGVALYRTNNLAGGNDQAAANVYTSELVHALLEGPRASSEVDRERD